MPRKNQNPPKPGGDQQSAAFEVLLRDYSSAVEALRRGDFEPARQQFEQVLEDAHSEPELADRAAMYVRICERQLAPTTGEPDRPEGMFRRAVFLLNSGETDEALQWLNRGLVEQPTSVDLLYVRACAWARKGAAEKAVGDLRQAMAVDPKVRFQAVNDPDFERIREEPAFIDVIEPTPTGA